MAERDRSLHCCARQIATAHGKVHMDVGEHFGFGIRTLRCDFHATTVYRMATAFQNQHHVVRGTAAHAHQQQLHRACR